MNAMTFAIPKEPDRCSILELSSSRCGWVEGDSRQPFSAIYCGAKKTDDPTRPYCLYHDVLAHGWIAWRGAEAEAA